MSHYDLRRLMSGIKKCQSALSAGVLIITVLLLSTMLLLSTILLLAGCDDKDKKEVAASAVRPLPA